MIMKNTLIRENLLKTLGGILIIVVVMSALGYWFGEELKSITNWVVDRIGFAGLCLIMLVSDTLVTPIPPDILLLVIAKSELSRHWLRYVLILGMVSTCAGMLGWVIGRRLGNFRFVKKRLRKLNGRHRDFIREYGFWGIVLGATTPLPYSVTCWTAGIVGMRWTTVLSASVLFRIPRIIIYYLLISLTGEAFN